MSFGFRLFNDFQIELINVNDWENEKEKTHIYEPYQVSVEMPLFRLRTFALYLRMQALRAFESDSWFYRLQKAAVASQ